jgi:hypothetical protein
MAKTMMAGMILREMETGKIFGGRVDMGTTTMKWCPQEKFVPYFSAQIALIAHFSVYV